MLAGMLLAAFAGRRFAGRSLGSLRGWVAGGCAASALALLGLAVGSQVGTSWQLLSNIVCEGIANGAFSIAAVGAMMQESRRGSGDAGLRMGVWGAAQALALAVGGIVGTGTLDLARHAFGSLASAFSAAFGFEAVLFLAAAALAMSLGRAARRVRPAAAWSTQAVSEVPR
jgi:BCD family chlorophyll transporter-like MFS transporter